MAIDGFHLNGPALVYANFVQDPLLLVGYTDYGARIRIIENYADIITDVFGPITPHDLQVMGMVANISVPFVASDRTNLKALLGRGDRTTQGQISTPGLVVGASSYAFKLSIASTADSPWTFPYCVTRPGFDTQLATKVNPFTLEVFAWPWASFTTTNAKDRTLWTRLFA